jgi:hypothetical protein
MEILVDPIVFEQINIYDRRYGHQGQNHGRVLAVRVHMLAASLLLKKQNGH